ncbi:MAG: ATP-binding protein [Thermodesulfobacteriota bacterium]
MAWGTLSEILRIVAFVALAVYLTHRAARLGIARTRSWFYVLTGFIVILVGLGLNLADDFPTLYRHITFRTASYESLFINAVVYPLGFLFIMIGVTDWARSAAQLRENEQALQKIRDELELRVQERTGQLKESELRLQSVLNSLDDAVVVVDSNAIIRDVNEATEKMLGYTKQEVIGRSIELFDVDDGRHAQVGRKIEEGLVLDDSVRFCSQAKRKDGTIFPVEHSVSVLVDATGARVGLVNAVRDITEVQRSEEILRQTERYKAVADLAGGVAHNFNNFLQIVIGHLELMKIELGEGRYDVVRNDLQTLVKASLSASETVRRLQTFAGLRDGDELATRGVLDLKPLLQQALDMTTSWWKTAPEVEGVAMSLNSQIEQGCVVRGERSALLEVIVNLIRNAAEAVMSTRGGEIIVTCTPQQGEVMISVADTGPGIPEEDLARIFNPFFTTKAALGSGLGLAASKRIVDNHMGRLTVESRPGVGTTFRVFLPAAEQTLDVVTELHPLPRDERITVLAVDDDERVLDMLRRTGDLSGYVTLTSVDGEKGIEVFLNNPVDVVICDLGMPGMTGWQVGKRIKQICKDRSTPKTPFILFTGWGGQTTESDKMQESGVDLVLEKPLDMEKVIETIRRMAFDYKKRTSKGGPSGPGGPLNPSSERMKASQPCSS